MVRNRSKQVTFGVICMLGLIIGVGRFSSRPVPDVNPTQTIIASTDTIPTPKLNGWIVEIKKIDVAAPIIMDVNGDDEKIYLKAIEKGVAHYKGTPHPGDEGNSVIFGHSSYFKNKPGDYKEVFKRLNEVAVGDVIKIRSSDTSIEYKVVKSQIIKDDDFSILDSTTVQTLTLLTCWPPGTIEKRYVVQAERQDASGKPWPTPSPKIAPKKK